MKYIADRLKEAGTYRVLGGLLAGIGGPLLTDGQLELAFQVGSGILLLWESLVPAKKD
jgi:hypothetical protein